MGYSKCNHPDGDCYWLGRGSSKELLLASLTSGCVLPQTITLGEKTIEKQLLICHLKGPCFHKESRTVLMLLLLMAEILHHQGSMMTSPSFLGFHTSQVVVWDF